MLDNNRLLICSFIRFNYIHSLKFYLIISQLKTRRSLLNSAAFSNYIFPFKRLPLSLPRESKFHIDNLDYPHLHQDMPRYPPLS